MPASLQLTDINPPESSSFQYQHHFAPTSGHDDSEETPGNHRPNTKEGHSGCTRGLEMLKLGRMHRQTGEKFVDLTAMWRQMREVSDC